jgi:predicted nucleic acid-binding protein
MAKKLLIDTDLLVDYLRELPAAVSYLESVKDDLVTSAIVVAELHAGVREGEERTALGQLLSLFEVIPVDANLAERGGLLRRDFGPRHGTGLADAIIAATAQQTGAELITSNAKYFPMLQHVTVPYTR